MTMLKGRLRAEHPWTEGPWTEGPWAAGFWAKVARRVAGTAAHALAWPARVVRARRLVGELSMLGEHGLRDIGLIPQDVRDAHAVLFAADPSQLLRDRASERRRAVLADRALARARPRRD